MNEMFEEVKKELLADTRFIHSTSLLHDEYYTKVRNRLVSLNIAAKVALPSVAIGYLACLVQDINSFFLKFLLFLSAIAAIVFAYGSVERSYDRLAQEVCDLQIIPNKIRESIKHIRGRDEHEILLQLQVETESCISLLKAVSDDKFNKAHWDYLYDSLEESRNLQEQYKRLSSDYDKVEKELPVDYVFSLSIKEKCK